MGKCCSDHSVPVLVASEYRVDRCLQCGAEHLMLYDRERIDQWREAGVNPLDEAVAYCSQRFPNARPKIKR